MLLDVFQMRVAMHGREIIRGIDIHIDKAEIVALLGANASGKTTILKTILGLVPMKEGRITLEGKALHRIPSKQRIRMGIGIVPENRRLFPDMTVAENLNLVTPRFLNDRQRNDIWEDLKDMFPVLRDARKWRQMAGSMSGGEQQQVAMARAILPRPRLLLLDEPSMGLSQRLVQTSFELLDSLRTKGVGILLVEQNLRSALKHANRGYVLQEGRIILEGDAASLAQNDLVRHAYMGEFVQ